MITVAQMNADPKFRALSYDEQMAVRRDVFSQQLARDPRFGQLNPQQKTKVLHDIIYAPPALKNQSTQKEILSLDQKLNSGDQNAIEFAKKELMLATLGKASLIANVVDRALVSPFLESLEGANENWDHADILQDPERKKLIQYMDLKLNSEGYVGRKFNNMRSALGMGVTLAEFVGLMAVGAGTTFAPRALGALFTAPTRSVLATSKVLQLSKGAKLAYRAGQSALHATATATIGWARESALDLIENSAENSTEFREVAEKNLKWFGGYFLGDIAMNAILDLALPMVGANIKVFTGKWGKAKAPAEELMADVMEFKPLDMKKFAQLEGFQQEAIMRTQAAMKTLRNVEDLNPESAIGLVAATHGATFKKLKSGRYSIKMRGDVAHSFDTLEEVNGFMKEKLLKNLSKDTAEKAGMVAGAEDRFVGRVTTKAVIDDLPAEARPVVAEAFAPVAGRYSRDGLEVAGKMFLKAADAPESMQRSLKVVSKGKEYAIKLQGKEIATVPKGYLGPVEEREIIDRLMGEFGRIKGTGYVKKATEEGVEAAVKQTNAMSLSQELRALYRTQTRLTPSYLDDVVQKQFGGNVTKTPKGYAIVYENGSKEYFKTLNDLGDHVRAKLTTVDDLAVYLKERFGIETRVNAAEGGIDTAKEISSPAARWAKEKKHPLVDTYEFRLRGERLDSGDDLLEILERNPMWTPKISGKYGPKFTVIDNKVGIEYHGGTLTGDKRKLMQFLSEFSDVGGQGKQLGHVGTKMTLTPSANQIELEIPSVGYRARYDSVEEAKKFAKGWNTYEGIEHIAFRKGYRIEYNGDTWIAYTSDGTTYAGKTLDDIKAYLGKEAPIPEWAPELTGIDESLLKTFKVPKEEGYVEDVLGRKAVIEPEYNVRAFVQSWFSPTRTHLETLVRQGGDPTVLKHYQSTETTRHFIKGEAYKFGQHLTDVFTPTGAKRMLNRKGRDHVKLILLSKGDPKRLEALTKGAKISFTDGEREVAKKVREMMGTDYMKGLAKKFDLSFDEFQYDYLPALRKGHLRNRKRHSSPASLIDASMDTMRAPKMKAFFKYSRTAELQEMMTSEDLWKNLTGYFNIGMRNKYLGPLLDNLNSTLKNTDDYLKSRYLIYLSQIGGIPQGFSEVTLRRISENILGKMGVESAVSKDISRIMMSWGYTAALGLRPALVVRNMNQIWTMLSPAVGHEWTVGALHKVVKDKGELFEKARRANVIRAQLPVYGGEVFGEGGPLSKVVHTALNWYKSSDDFTRVVAYTAGTDRFMDAVKRLEANPKMTFKEFADFAGINRMPPDLKQLIYGDYQQALAAKAAGNTKVANFRFEVAADRYATQLTRETMFEYTSGNGSMAFRGAMGKLFGMFGTYPLYYVDNIRRSIQYASAAEKVAFAGRWLANGTALYGAFAAAGIRMEAFKPWSPMSFSGGPFYEMFNQALSAAAGDEAAFRNLVGLRAGGWDPTKGELAQWAIPFGFAVKDLRDSVEEFSNGNLYRGFLTLTGFSLFDDEDDPLAEFLSR